MHLTTPNTHIGTMTVATDPTPEPPFREGHLPEDRLASVVEDIAAVEERLKALRDERREEMRRLRAQGWHLSDIAKIAKVSDSFVKRACDGQR